MATKTRPAPWVLAAAGTLLATMSGCSLVLDFGAAPPDALVDAPPPDAFIISPELCGAGEANNSAGTAHTLAPLPATFMAALCSQVDDDFYVINVTDNSEVTIDLTFEHRGGAGDLALRLAAAATPTMDIAASNSQDDNEQIIHTIATGGDYIIEVSSPNGRENTYTLSVMVMSGAATLQP